MWKNYWPLLILPILFWVKKRFLPPKAHGEIAPFTTSELSQISVKNLLTPTELKFYKLLKKAVSEFEVHAQVAVYQLLKIQSGNESHKIFNRLNRMTFDFVITDSETNVLAIVELDDKSHSRLSAKKRDLKKDSLMSHLNRPLIRIDGASKLTATEIRSLLDIEIRKTSDNS